MGGPNTAHRMLHSLLPVLHDCGNALREAGLQADQLFNIEHVCDNMLRYRCWLMGCWDSAPKQLKLCLSIAVCWPIARQNYVNYRFYRVELCGILQQMDFLRNSNAPVTFDPTVYLPVGFRADGNHSLYLDVRARKEQSSSGRLRSRRWWRGGSWDPAFPSAKYPEGHRLQQAYITFVMFLIATCACNSIDSNVSQVYMTNDLKFSRESLSLVKVVSAPANIVCAILSSYLSSAKPFKFFYYTTCWCMFMSCYSIFVLLRTFPSDPLEQQSPFNIFHVTAVILLTDLAQNFWFTTVFVIVA